MNKKNIVITIIITTVIFLFIGFLTYSIYRYGYYDKHEEENYTQKINQKDLTFIYDKLIKDDSLTEKDFHNSIKISLNRTTAEEIYKDYYSEKYLLEEFLNLYWYGNPTVKTEDITFSSKGKTTYTKKRKLYYESISLKNNDNETKIGIIKNITFQIEPSSTLYLDDQEICNESQCIIEKIYGGIHSIKYISNNFEYFGLVNIKEDNANISIPHLDSLIKTRVIEVIQPEIPLLRGYYILTECYMEAYCPKKISNLSIYEDGVAKLNLDINITDAKDYYEGTYKINNNVLELNFDHHTFKALDYDNGYYTTFEIDTPRKITFKIEDEKTIVNSDYKFKFSRVLN